MKRDENPATAKNGDGHVYRGMMTNARLRRGNSSLFAATTVAMSEQERGRTVKADYQTRDGTAAALKDYQWHADLWRRPELAGGRHERKTTMKLILLTILGLLGALLWLVLLVATNFSVLTVSIGLLALVSIPR